MIFRGDAAATATKFREAISDAAAGAGTVPSLLGRVVSVGLAVGYVATVFGLFVRTSPDTASGRMQDIYCESDGCWLTGWCGLATWRTRIEGMNTLTLAASGLIKDISRTNWMLGIGCQRRGDYFSLVIRRQSERQDKWLNVRLNVECWYQIINDMYVIRNL